MEAVECGEKSESGKKIRRKRRREFLTPYPSPWPFFLFASICTVPTKQDVKRVHLNSEVTELYEPNIAGVVLLFVLWLCFWFT